MAEPTWDQIWNTFVTAFRADPAEYQRYQDKGIDDVVMRAPIEDIPEKSQALNVLRQYGTDRLGNTGAGRWVLDQLPESENEKSFISRLRRSVENLPLGGMSDAEKASYSSARASDPELRMRTLEVGKVPVPPGTPNAGPGAEMPTGDSFRLGAAQLAGATAADLATDGARNIWWFLNAPQALAYLATMQAMHGAGQEFKAAHPDTPYLKNRNMRMAAAVPAWLGMSMAIGNAWRQPGFKAVVPSEVDPTKSADPVGEALSRYLLGRTGSLLPYEEFVQERPDVSRQEYDNYKQYLFGNAFPIKATLEGINGPEVTFMGKSIPLATGILPTAAAAIGARMGMRKAAARLHEAGALEEAERLRTRAMEIKRDATDPRSGVKKGDAAIAAAAYEAKQRANEAELLKQTLLYSGGGMAATALAGQTLESLRRALKGRAEYDPEADSLPTTQVPLV